MLTECEVWTESYALWIDQRVSMVQLLLRHSISDVCRGMEHGQGKKQIWAIFSLKKVMQGPSLSIGRLPMTENVPIGNKYIIDNWQRSWNFHFRNLRRSAGCKNFRQLICQRNAQMIILPVNPISDTPAENVNRKCIATYVWEADRW